MARKGIEPLSTTMALAFTSWSSTTSQRPIPKKITAARINPPPAMTPRAGNLRERGRKTVAELSGLVIGEPAHAIPPRASGQSVTGRIHCRTDFLRRPHARGGDGRGGVSGFASLRQAAGGGVGSVGGGQFHYRRERQPEPSGEE